MGTQLEALEQSWTDTLYDGIARNFDAQDNGKPGGNVNLSLMEFDEALGGGVDYTYDFKFPGPQS